MKSESIRTALLAIAVAALCLVAWDIHTAARKTIAYGHSIGPVFSTTLSNINDTSLTVKQNSGAELQEMKKAAAGASDLFRHTDDSLNGRKAHPGLIPQLTTLMLKSQAAMDNLNASILHLDALIQSGGATMQEMQATVSQFRKSIADLDAIITDPKIRETLNNLALASAEMAATLKQLNALLVSGTSTAEDIRQVADKYREEYVKARNIFWSLFKELLPLAGSAAQVVK